MATVVALGLIVAAHAQSADPKVSTLEEGKLSVCLYPGFAPVASLDSSGQWVGTDVDFLSDFATSLGLAFQPVEQQSFEAIWAKPGQDLCDVAATGIAKTPSRVAESPGTVWTIPYFATERSFAVRAGDEEKLTAIEDLAGKKVITTKDSTADYDLLRRLAQAQVPDVTVVYTDDEVEGVERVAAGEFFAYAGGLVSVAHLAKSDPRIAVAWPHPYLEEDGTTEVENFNFVVRERSQGLAAALDAYIEANKESYGKE